MTDVADVNGHIEEVARTISDEDKRAVIRGVRSSFDTTFTWDYRQGERPALAKLYEKAKHAQWDAQSDIDWTVDGQVDVIRAGTPASRPPAPDGPFAKLNDDELATLRHATMGWMVSQFVHGEQGALVCTARIVESVPWLDAKYYAATQVMDEARHVEVFSRYLNDKIQWTFPINVHLRDLLDAVVADERWDFTYLGMQIMIEGLALAGFSFHHQTTPDPLLRQITRFVMADEARHVAFGVLSLREAYEEMTDAEVRERQEFCYEAALLMRDRFLAQEVWESLGLPMKECSEAMLRNPAQVAYRQLLFAKVVPNLKKLGLLDAGSGWLRDRFRDLGVIHFEDFPDTEVELDDMQLPDRGSAAGRA